MSAHTDFEYFMQEDSSKNLARELVNFKFRVHKLIPKICVSNCLWNWMLQLTQH